MTEPLTDPLALVYGNKLTPEEAQALTAKLRLASQGLLCN